MTAACELGWLPDLASAVNLTTQTPSGAFLSSGHNSTQGPGGQQETDTLLSSPSHPPFYKVTFYAFLAHWSQWGEGQGRVWAVASAGADQVLTGLEQACLLRRLSLKPHLRDCFSDPHTPWKLPRLR